MHYSGRVLLKGSCHCRAVRFSVRSETPFPYLWCYCSICRKTGGGGGYVINIMGVADSLKIEGKRHLAERDRFGSNEPAQRANPATLADDVDVLGSTLDLEPHHQLLHGFASR